MNNDYITETISKQIDKKHYVKYYFSNCYGDDITTFTLYEGDICVPEYSKEIIHSTEFAKRYNEEEIIEKGKMILKSISLIKR